MLSTYLYKAYNKNGTVEEGKIRAISTQEAFAEVKNMGLIPQKIWPEGGERFDFKEALERLKTERHDIVRDRNRSIAMGLSILFIILFLVLQLLKVPEIIKISGMYASFLAVIVLVGFYFKKV